MNNKYWSDMLNYKPRIEYEKRKTKHQESMISEEINLTSNLNGYINNNPRNSIVILKDGIEQMDEFIKTCNEVILKEKIEEEIDFNLNGNSIVEIKDLIYKEKDLLINISNDLSDCFYGTRDIDKINELEDSKIQTLVKFEKEDQVKVNYSLMAIDSYVSSAIQAFTTEIVIQGGDMLSYNTVRKDIVVEGDNESISLLLENYYKKNQNKSTIVFNEASNILTSGIQQNQLYGVLNKRELLNSSIKADSSLKKYNDDNYIELIMNLKDENINECFETTEDFIKSLLLISTTKEDYMKTLKEREGIKNIYKGV